MKQDLFNPFFQKNTDLSKWDFSLASLHIDAQKILFSPSCMDYSPVDTHKAPSSFVLTKKLDDAIVLSLEGSIHPDYQAVDWVLWLENTSTENSKQLNHLHVADISFPCEEGEAIFHRGIKGDSNSGNSFLPFNNKLLPEKSIRIAPEGGRSSCFEFPSFDLVSENGEGYIVSIGWSGQWEYTLTRDKDFLHLTIGLEDGDFYLLPNEKIRLPRVLFKGYTNKTDGHNNYRQLIFHHYSPKNADGSPISLPSALQCFDRYAFTNPYWASEAGQKEYALCAARIGNIDTVWLDAAWFEGAFPHGVGNYNYGAGFPDGLKPVSDRIHSLGMNFMLWFEPERVAYDTQMDQLHSQWIIKDPDAKPWGWVPLGQSPSQRRANGLLNLANDEVVDFLIEHISAMLQENQVDIYRQDFNIAPLPFWRIKDCENRKGMTEIHYIMGLYRFWDALRNRFPTLLIDNCASGGRRIDLETCMRSVPLWRSDTGCSPLSDARPSDLWNQNQSLSLSNYLVYHSVAAWNWGAYEFRSAATNGMAANFDVFNPDFDYSRAGECMLEFTRLRKYWAGDFYPHTTATLDDSIWCAFQFHRKAEDDGLLLLFRRAQSPYDCATFSLKGIDKNALYHVVFSDEQREIRLASISGEELSKGYTFSLPERRTSLVVEYRKESEPL